MSELDSVSFTGVTMLSLSLVTPSTLSSDVPDVPEAIRADHRSALLHDSLVLFSSVVTDLPETPEVAVIIQIIKTCPGFVDAPN